MNRALYRERHRRTFGVALVVSVATHLAILTFLKVEVPPVPERDRERATRLIDLADVWEDRPLEVVRLNDAPTAATPDSDLAATAPASSADAEAPATGAARASTVLAAFESARVLTGTGSAATEMSLELAEEVRVASVGFKSAQRGVVLRTATSGPAGDVGLDFEAASDAAREAERRRGGLGGTGGIGITIIGGGDCDAPGSIGLPGISGRAGGIGSLPRFGAGRGLIGRTGSFGSAINRVAPGRP